MTAEVGFIGDVKNYGLVPSLRAKFLHSLRRFFDFEFCVLLMNSGKPYEFDLPAEIPVEAVACPEEFHTTLHEQVPEIDYAWAFKRGDQCIVNKHDGVIVGYEFSTNLPTPVNDGIEIFFPEWCGYGYASFTAPAYRGQRLAKHRWPESRRQKTLKHGTPPREVFYINLKNLAGLKSDAADGVPSLRLGYGLWLRLFGRYWCWNSRAARRNGIGFRSAHFR
ncbi:MAG: hypothetical protein AAF541_17170 [Pseudomonadota bacterium]